MRLLFALSTLAMFVGLPAAAHDFWLQPETFYTDPGRPVAATLQVGHGPARQRSPIPIDRITAFRSNGPDGVVDQRHNLSLGDPDADAHFTFTTPGAYVVSLETNGAFSNLPSIRFNDYARAEGLTAATEWRRTSSTEDAPGRELYSRRAKALIGVSGDAPSGSTVTEPVGLSLEIVPAVDPTLLAPGKPFAIHVLYEGEPLLGALVKLTDLAADERPVEQRVTDTSGSAQFAVPHAGSWLLNVVWSEPLPPNRKADFITTFSSLSFGVGSHGK